MESILLLLAGITIGTYYAEPIREKVPILDPDAKSKEEGAA